MPANSTLVVIPTYNERESIERILPRVLALGVDVLVVDDASPDGTGDYVDDLAAHEPQVSLLRRPRKDGLGPAYIAGFTQGLARGYTVLFEFDADGSHPPEQIPRMLEILNTDESGRIGGVIGSRWVEGGSVINWPKRREFVSRGGSWYARTMLGLKVRDVTAGFRAYRADALRAVSFNEVESQGYCFQIDMTRRMIGAGFELVEIPIQFRDRELGESKMSAGIAVEAMAKVTQWALVRLVRRAPVAPQG